MANNSKSSGSNAGAGLGIAATLVATAAGLYYLYGKNGSKHRQQVRGWMLRAKGEVLDKLGTLEEVTESSYNRIVDDVMKQYKKYQDVDKTELANIAVELRRAWGGIKSVAKDVNRAGKSSRAKSSAKRSSASGRKKSSGSTKKTSA